MLNTTAILGFLLKFIVWFALLMYVPVIVPWIAIDRAYAKIMIAEGNFFFGDFGADGRVQFKPLRDDPQGRDVLLEYSNLRDNTHARNGGKTRTTGYWPTAYLMALILASPVPWKRRGIALGAGFLLAQVFVCFRLFILILVPFCTPGSDIQLFEVSELTFKFLGFLHWVFVKSFAGGFVLPLLIWFPLCFRISDWKQQDQAAASA